MGTSRQTTTSVDALWRVTLFASSAIRLVSAGPAQVNDSQCGCYMTNGSETAFLTTHKFFDFRTLPQFAGVPDVITNINDTAKANSTSPYFDSDLWTSSWNTQRWNNSDGNLGDSSVYMQNSLNNVYIEANPEADGKSPLTWLTMRTHRLPHFQTSAEIESASKGFHYVSVRMLARTVGSAGACTSLFTYRDQGSAPPQEADIEVLTKDPRNVIQYTNQPSVNDAGDVIVEASDNATLPKGLDWGMWAVHRYDWTPGKSTWYFDGVQVAQISFQTPRDPTQILMNVWSDGGPWTGNMTVNHSASMQIQWLDLVYNTTDKAVKTQDSKRDVCCAVCSLDLSPVAGKPVLLWDNGARGGLDADVDLAGWVALAVVAVILMV